jgi:hypothetical protein
MVREGLQSPCSLRSVAVFLKELQGASAAYLPWYVGRSELEHSAARNQNHQAQALQEGWNRFALNELGLCAAPAHTESPGGALPVPYTLTLVSDPAHRDPALCGPGPPRPRSPPTSTWWQQKPRALSSKRLKALPDQGSPALSMIQRLARRGRSVFPANFRWYRVADGRISSKVRENPDQRSVPVVVNSR